MAVRPALLLGGGVVSVAVASACVAVLATAPSSPPWALVVLAAGGVAAVISLAAFAYASVRRARYIAGVLRQALMAAESGESARDASAADDLERRRRVVADALARLVAAGDARSAGVVADRLRCLEPEREGSGES